MLVEAERRFPVRIRIGVPPEGLGGRLDQMRAWLDGNCGAEGWALTPSGVIANLIVSRPGPGRRSTLYNRRFAIRDVNGQVTRRVLSGFNDYRDILVQHFDLSLDDEDIAAIATAMESHAADEEVLCYFR